MLYAKWRPRDDRASIHGVDLHYGGVRGEETEDNRAYGRDAKQTVSSYAGGRKLEVQGRN